jgi:hypothetical protein
MRNTFFAFPYKKEERIRIKMESAAKNASSSWENLLPEMFCWVKKKKIERVSEWKEIEWVSEEERERERVSESEGVSEIKKERE